MFPQSTPLVHRKKFQLNSMSGICKIRGIDISLVKFGWEIASDSENNYDL